MRKVVMILSLLLCASYCAKAQYADTAVEDTSFLHQVTITPSGYVSVNAGSGKEVAGFNGTGYQLVPSAATGPYVNISLCKPLSSHVGFSLLAGYCVNNTNTAYYCGGWEQQYAANATITNASNQDFNELVFLAGPFVTLPYHRISIDFRLLVGTMDWNSPATSYIAVSPSGVQTPEQVTGQNYESYVYVLGIGARMRLYRAWALIANADYMRSFGGGTNPFVLFDTLTAGVAYQL